MKLALIAISTGVLWSADCIQVSSNTIAARDLADAIPLFRSLEPEAVIGFAPAPGIQRVLTSRELLAIARQQGLQPEPGASVPSVCVERTAHVIDPEELKDALKSALGIQDARLEVLDFSRQPVPPGRLDFSLTGLGKPPQDTPSAPVIWRGRLVYDGQRSLAIWAKVSVTVERPELVASEQIAAGAIIGAGQVAVRTLEQFPFGGPTLDSASQVIGKTARRTILSGQRIQPTAIVESSDVARGETVHVVVIDGQARLSLDAIAESSGRKGDAVLVRNPTTGKDFRGVVEDRGKVIVRSSAGDE